MPFYQPLASLELFERSISGRDIATGKKVIQDGYRTSGPHLSSFREGNQTVQTTVVPANATYNSTTNAPNQVQARLAVRPRFRLQH